MSHALLQRAHSSQAVHDAFLAAVVYAHQQLFGKPRMWVELENHGRTALPTLPGAHNTVGWLATRYPVVFDLPAQPTWATAAAQVKTAIAQVPHHGKSYGLLHMQGKPGLAFKADIKLYYRGRLDSTFRPDAQFPVFNVQHMNNTYTAGPLGARLPLLLSISRKDHGFVCLFYFDTQSYSSDQSTKLVALMEQALQEVESD